MMETAPARMNSSDVASALRTEIETMRYLPRDRLPPERSLAERFGVARGTVREALKRLEDAGFVQRRAGSGTYVSDTLKSETQSIIQSTSPLELMDARSALEPQNVRLAVLNATANDIAALERILIDCEAASNDIAAYAQADDQLHFALAKCARNSLLIWMYERVNEVRSQPQWARMRELTLSAEMIRLYNQQHRAIFEAIRGRNADAASAMVIKHLQIARSSLVDAASN
jgi:GntR family uxuAB operon transcriptional repressor